MSAEHSNPAVNGHMYRLVGMFFGSSAKAGHISSRVDPELRLLHAGQLWRDEALVHLRLVGWCTPPAGGK